MTNGAETAKRYPSCPYFVPVMSTLSPALLLLPFDFFPVCPFKLTESSLKLNWLWETEILEKPLSANLLMLLRLVYTQNRYIATREAFMQSESVLMVLLRCNLLLKALLKQMFAL